MLCCAVPTLVFWQCQGAVRMVLFFPYCSDKETGSKKNQLSQGQGSEREFTALIVGSSYGIEMNFWFWVVPPALILGPQASPHCLSPGECPDVLPSVGRVVLKVLVAQSCLVLCDPMGCSPPGSSVHGILQAGILEWAAMPSSRWSSWPRDQTWVSHIAGRLFTIWVTRKIHASNLEAWRAAVHGAQRVRHDFAAEQQIYIYIYICTNLHSWIKVLIYKKVSCNLI